MYRRCHRHQTTHKAYLISVVYPRATSCTPSVPTDPFVCVSLIRQKKEEVNDTHMETLLYILARWPQHKQRSVEQGWTSSACTVAHTSWGDWVMRWMTNTTIIDRYISYGTFTSYSSWEILHFSTLKWDKSSQDKLCLSSVAMLESVPSSCLL